MQNDSFFLFIRFVFTGLFLACIFAGIMIWKNYERLFGVDPTMPSENGSARTYTKVQVLAVWAHAFLLTGGFALLLH
jgi:hypothetical protein